MLGILGKKVNTWKPTTHHLVCSDKIWMEKGFWKCPPLMAFQVQAICRDYGVVCIRREGKDIEKIIAADDILCENKVCQFMNF